MMNFFIITTTIFLFFSHATLTLGMAIDSSASVSKLEDKDVYTAIFELDPETLDPVDTVRFDHNITSNVDPKDAGSTNTLSRRDVPPTLYCETSDASPYTKDVYDVADWMGNPKLHGEWNCKQTTWWGSHCTRVQWSGTAAAGLCGTLWFKTRCSGIARAVRTIARTCSHRGKAGGQIVFRVEGYYLIVYHSGK